jgi:membrane fusion protein (multidrug efflux system)
VGQRILALVPTNLWVTANFKETQLKKIRIGQSVKISIDSVAGKTFDGHIESIQAGSGAAFSLLPPENAVGNYVKVVQRVPVRIFFDSPVQTEHVLGPGMSATPSVHVSGFQVPEVITLIIAVTLALVAGFFWRKLANKNNPPA